MQLYFLKNFFNFRKFLFVFFSLVFFLWPLYEVKAESSDAWWDFNWSRRIELKIDHTKVTGNLSNFPVYINLANLPSEFWDAVNSTNGGDIRITNKSGTQLPREIVSFTDSGSSGTGELHFLADSLSSASDSIFYIYVGNPSITHDYLDTDTHGAEAVWADYIIVSHDGTKDSAGNSPLNPINEIIQGAETGFIGKATDFTKASGKYISAPSINESITEVSFSVWINLDTGNNNFSGIINSRGTNFLNLLYNNSKIGYSWDSAFNTWTWNSNLVIPTNSWSFLSLTVKPSINQAKAYVSTAGILNSSENNIAHAASQIVNNLVIGTDTDNAVSRTIGGTLDEIRMCRLARFAEWIGTEFNNQSSPNTFYSSLSENPPLPYFDLGWSSKIQFTLNGDLVNAPGSGSLTDFPVYLDLSQMPDEFFQIVRSDGGDIRITDSSDNELPRELVSINRSAKTGEVHFKTDLENGADATFYLYYGKPDASDYQDSDDFGRNNVWDENYVLVSHDGGFTDSSGTGNNGASYGPGGPTIVPNGKIGSDSEFGGDGDRYLVLDSDNSLDVSDQFTLSAWIYCQNLTSAENRLILVKGSEYLFRINHTDDLIHFHIYDGADYEPHASSNPNKILENEWSLVTLSYDNFIATKKNKVYKNGALTGSLDSARSYIATNSSLQIGSWGEASNRFLGKIDEIRISNIARSEEWIETEYANQNSASAFIKATKVIHSKSWYHDGWSNRIELVIESDKVPTDIWDFPVFVDMSSFPLVFFNKVKSDGVDIRITTEGNFELAREIVSFSKALKMGELYFKSNYLSSTKDTKFYIYYGNGDAADYPDTGDYGTHEVWSDYVLVSHDGGRTDSTENLNHGTPMNAPTIVQGIVGNDASFLTGPGYYLISHKPVLELTGDLTYSFFTKYDSSPAGWSPILAKLLSDNANELCFRFGGATSQNYYGNGTLNTLMSFNKHPAGQWFHYMSSRDISEGDLYLYGNGIQHAPAILNGLSSVSNTASPLYVGIAPGHQFTGYIDELRIKKKYEPESFANTEFENLKNNSSFLRTGRIQTPYSSKALFFGGF